MKHNTIVRLYSIPLHPPLSFYIEHGRLELRSYVDQSQAEADSSFTTPAYIIQESTNLRLKYISLLHPFRLHYTGKPNVAA